MKRRILSLLLVICMVATLVPTVFGAGERNIASIRLAKGYTTNTAGTDVAELQKLAVNEGGDPVYALTTEEGLITRTDATAENYNIKFEYPTGGTPTLYLKGAKIENKLGYAITPEYDRGLYALKVVVESDSSITAAKTCIYSKGGDLTITGPGKLTLETTEVHSVVSVLKTNDTDRYDLYIQDANIELTCNAVSSGLFIAELGDMYMENSTIKGANRNGIAVKANNGSISATNCTLDIESTWTTFEANNGNFTLINCTVNAVSGFKAIYADKDVLLKNTTAFLEGDHFEHPVIDVRGDFVIDNCTLELYGLDMPVFSEATLPTFVGYYRAIAGTDEDSATRYDEEFYNVYQYIKIVPADTPEESTEETYEDETEETTEESTVGTNQTSSNAPTQTPSANPSGTNVSAGNSSILWIVAIVVLLGVFAAAAIIIIKKSKAAK